MSASGSGSQVGDEGGWDTGAVLGIHSTSLPLQLLCHGLF